MELIMALIALRYSLHFLCALIAFIIVPVLAGRFISEVTGTVSKDYLVCGILGYAMLWSTVEVLSVVVTLLKLSFMTVVVITGMIMLASAVMGCAYLHRNKKHAFDIKGIFKDYTKVDYAALIIFAVAFLVFLYLQENTLFVDQDDSRFLVNGLDILKSDHILLTDPNTGGPIGRNYHDFGKDLVSQWSSYLAFCSRVSGIYLTVFAHMVYPIIAYMLLMAIYDKILVILAKDREKARPADRFLVLTLILVIYCFGNYSVYNSETFTVVRIWQGKASVSSIGIMMIIWIFLMIHNDSENLKLYILLAMADLSLCLMSGMGVAISAMLIGVGAVCCSIYKKNIKMLLIPMAVCVPNLILMALSNFYKIRMFLG